MCWACCCSCKQCPEKRGSGISTIKGNHVDPPCVVCQCSGYEFRQALDAAFCDGPWLPLCMRQCASDEDEMHLEPGAVAGVKLPFSRSQTRRSNRSHKRDNDEDDDGGDSDSSGNLIGSRSLPEQSMKQLVASVPSEPNVGVSVVSIDGRQLAGAKSNRRVPLDGHNRNDYIMTGEQQ